MHTPTEVDAVTPDELLLELFRGALSEAIAEEMQERFQEIHDRIDALEWKIEGIS